MCKAKHYITQLTDIMNDIEADFSQLKENMSTCDKIEQDILHKIEFGKYNAFEGWQMIVAIKNNRTECRNIKNEFETIKQLRDITSNQLNKLNSTGGKIAEIETRQNEAKYKPRVLKSPEDFQLIVGGM